MAVSSGYWCDQRLIVTVDGPDGCRSITLNRPFARIGGSAPAEIVLPGGTVPRRWLYLHGSPHGVFWLKLPRSSPGEKHTHGWLDAGQWLACGACRVGAQLAGSGADLRPGPDWLSEGSAQPPYPVIVLSTDGQVIDRQTLTRRLTIVGRHSPATVQIANRSVSNSHCALFVDAGQLWVVDLLSSNGTRLSGAPIESARLSEGETLRLGRIDLTFEGFSIGEERSAIFETLVEADKNDDLIGSAANLENRLARLEAQKGELLALREQWRREQDRREAAMAKRLSELEASRAALDARWLEFEQRQSSLQQELAAQRQQWEEQCIAWRERQEAAERQLAAERQQLDAERRSWRAEQQRIASQRAAESLEDQDACEAADSQLVDAGLTAGPAALGESGFEARVAGLGLLCAPAAVDCPPQPGPVERATAPAGANGDAERLDDQARIREALAAFHQRKQGGIFSSLLRLLRRGEV
jgi:hypothetical protein